MSNETPNTSKSFNKIKINDKKVEVHYVRHLVLPNDEGLRNIQIPMISDIKPHKDFFDAFQKIKETAIVYMEFSNFKNKVSKEVLEKHVVTTVSITEDTETVKIQISMNKYLGNNKCFSVTSPLIDLEHEDFSEIEQMREAYWDMISEAKLYLGGKNGEIQLKLVFEAAA